MASSKEAILVSKNLQTIAKNVANDIREAAGTDVAFSLFVFAEGDVQYISSSTNRPEIKKALMAILDGWDKGMPDVPGHEKN